MAYKVPAVFQEGQARPFHRDYRHYKYYGMNPHSWFRCWAQCFRFPCLIIIIGYVKPKIIYCYYRRAASYSTQNTKKWPVEKCLSKTATR